MKPHGLFILAAWVVLLWGISEARSFLIPLCIAALLALLLSPLFHFLKKRRVPGGIAVFLVALTLILPVLSLVTLMVAEGEKLVRDWPQINESLTRLLAQLQSSPLAEKLHLTDFLDPAALSQWFSEKAGEGVKIAVGSLRAMLSAGSHLILILFFAIVMLASGDQLRVSIERILERHESLRSAALLDKITSILERFLMARLTIVAFVIVIDFLILKLFGLPYGIMMSVWLGLMTLVPVIGFFVGVAPPLAVCLLQGGSGLEAAGIFLTVGAVSSFQDHFLAPKLIGERLNLNFLLTYLAIFGGERLWGIWGMFLSIPVLGVIRVILMELPESRHWARLLEGHSEKKPNSQAAEVAQ